LRPLPGSALTFAQQFEFAIEIAGPRSALTLLCDFEILARQFQTFQFLQVAEEHLLRVL
jgi:hypothetical protein